MKFDGCRREARYLRDLAQTGELILYTVHVTLYNNRLNIATPDSVIDLGFLLIVRLCINDQRYAWDQKTYLQPGPNMLHSS